jgi:hypothetical protein
LVIDTPSGPILIERLDTDKRKLKITMPDDISAFVGTDRALNSSKYVDMNMKPKFTVLTPRLDAEGKLLGVTKATKVSLK